jgi:hypothetical protein
MGSPDDYRDEMGRLSSRDAEEVLSGRQPEGVVAEAAMASATRLRKELLIAPSPEVAQRHLAAMRSAATSWSRTDTVVAMRKPIRRQLASLGLAAALMLGAGIAGALTLPETASEHLKQKLEDLQPPKPDTATGVPSVTNSAQPEAPNGHGKTVSDVAHDDATKGCEHGRAVSDLASSKADGHRQNQGENPDSCGPNEGQGGGASSGAHDAKGTHGKSDDAHGKSDAAHDAKGTHGQGDGPQSQSDTSHGQNDSPHGKGASPHGQGDSSPGQSAEEHGRGLEIPELPEDLPQT